MFPTLRRCVSYLIVLLILQTTVLRETANAGTILTPAGASEGFSLSTFATGFPTSGTTGPLGIAFPAGGGVLVSDVLGNVRFFTSNSNGQTASSAPVAQNFGANNAFGIAKIGNNFYMTQYSNGKVVQINANGAFVQNIASGLLGPAGIVADPANGLLFLSNQGTDQIFELNPIAKTTTVFASGVSGPDGITISADGGIVYVAATGIGRILGFDTNSATQVFDSGFIPGGIDGLALGFGSLAGSIFANTNSGTIVAVNLATHLQTTIVEGGSRGDFVAADPSNGTLLVTQTDSIIRLSAPADGSFAASVPELSSVLVFCVTLSSLAGFYGSQRLKRQT